MHVISPVRERLKLNSYFDAACLWNIPQLPSEPSTKITDRNAQKLPDPSTAVTRRGLEVECHFQKLLGSENTCCCGCSLEFCHVSNSPLPPFDLPPCVLFPRLPFCSPLQSPPFVCRFCTSACLTSSKKQFSGVCVCVCFYIAVRLQFFLFLT